MNKCLSLYFFISDFVYVWKLQSENIIMIIKSSSLTNTTFYSSRLALSSPLMPYYAPALKRHWQSAANSIVKQMRQTTGSKARRKKGMKDLQRTRAHPRSSLEMGHWSMTARSTIIFSDHWPIIRSLTHWPRTSFEIVKINSTPLCHWSTRKATFRVRISC